MILDDEQKAVFARWLELQISTSEGIQRQMAKLNMHPALLTKEKTEQAACQIVLRMITSGETMTLEAERPKP